MSNPASISLAELATTRPGATAVFHEHQLDFCCGGKRTLEEVCAERGLDALHLLEKIASEETNECSVARAARAPDTELIRHIVEHYHARLRRDLPQLIEMARKVEARHHARGDHPAGLAGHLESMAGELAQHMEKEEQVLFPLVLSGRGALAGGPISVMEQEHADAAADLLRTRELTDDLTPPADACTTWRSLYLRLAALESDLKDHIHLENNVLFPRALNG